MAKNHLFKILKRSTVCALFSAMGGISAFARQDTPPTPASTAVSRKPAEIPVETLAAAPKPLPSPLKFTETSDNDSSEKTSPVSGSQVSVVLLSNGHVFQGEIVEDGTGYYLKHKIGVKHFARRNVEGVFPSLLEAFQHLQARSPQNDPDEQMKLALWCLEQKLVEPARVQLETVLSLSPENKRAKAMLFHLNSKSQAPSDAQLARASAEVKEEFPPGAPRPLNLDKIRELNRQRGASTGPPIILDLSPPVALRRYQEFARAVHPELQTHCARCHDADSYTGRYQLYRTRTKRDLSNELILRANLDATLQLVDAEDLNHSRLLSVAAMTHPPDGRPVLSGPNHPSYRVFLTWVRSLSETGQPGSQSFAANGQAESTPVRKPSGLVPVRTNLEVENADEEVFASGRMTEGDPAKAGIPQAVKNESVAPQPSALAPKKISEKESTSEVSAPGVPANVYFPPAQMPKQIKLDSSVKTATGSATGITSKPEVQTNDDGTEAIRLPDGSLVPYVSSKALKTPPPADGPDPAKQNPPGMGKPKTKLDSKALQQFMSRGASSPQPSSTQSGTSTSGNSAR